MGIRATDKERNLFLKGFKLSKQGGYEDPTYLGFKVVFDFGNLPIGVDDGLPPSPLLKPDNYTTLSGANSMVSQNPFGQPQYNFRKSPDGIAFYSAAKYLEEREFGFTNGGKRSDMVLQFSSILNDLVSNYPWFLQGITGLDTLAKVERTGFPDSSSSYGGSSFNSQRTSGKTLEFKTLESLNLRMTALANLYNQATFDYDNMRELLPRNLRRFTMYIFVSEIRNFFKTSRLIGSSAALTAIDNFSNLLSVGNNPGSNSGTVTNSISNEQNREYPTADPQNPSSSFNSFVGGILNNAGLDNDFSLLKDQQDQSGIKPVIVFECKNCEFEFPEIVPFAGEISQGSTTATPAAMSFKIHVGRVRTRMQFPNIRQDGKPLILADSWDGVRSSVQQNPKSGTDVLSIGSELLTNFISSSLNDLVNEGVSSIAQNLSGINQTVLGNAYSFNPSQISASLSFNNAQNFLNSLGNISPGTQLPNPQTTGLGGPPERAYPPPGGDVYEQVPGRDLGSPQRVYSTPSGDAYAEVPGTDLGAPQRVYPQPNGDAYDKVPGEDLGVPQRVYPSPVGDVYSQVPGEDLGAPQRVYPQPTGDVYDQVPGEDLGAPQRVYPAPGGDVYGDVPGSDLGAPQRVYPKPSGDVYEDVPGEDLGVPQRVYGSIKEDVYGKVPGEDLGGSERKYKQPEGKVYSESELSNSPNEFKSPEKVYPDESTVNPGGIPPQRVYVEPPLVNFNGELRDPSNTFDSAPRPVYPEVPKNIPRRPRGEFGKAYPEVSGDFKPQKPKDLGNLKPSDKYNISTGGFNPDPSKFD